MILSNVQLHAKTLPCRPCDQDETGQTAHLLQLHWDWRKPKRNRWSNEGKSVRLKIVQNLRLKRVSTSMCFEGCRMHQVNPAKFPASCRRVAFALTPGSKLHHKPIGTLDPILMLLVTFQICKYSQDVKCSKITGTFSSTPPGKQGWTWKEASQVFSTNCHGVLRCYYQFVKCKEAMSQRVTASFHWSPKRTAMAHCDSLLWKKLLVIST